MSNNIIIDIDDTISQTQVEILKYVNTHSSGVVYNYHDITYDHREKANGEYDFLVREWLNKPELVNKTLPFNGALESFKKLHNYKFKIHIVSSRKENLHKINEDWLAKHGFIDYIHNIHPRNSSIAGEEFKLQIAKKIKPLAIFDDTWSVAKITASYGFNVYLISTPWNNNLKLPNVTRCLDFNTGVDLFLEKHFTKF